MRRSLVRTMALVMTLVLCVGTSVMANPSIEWQYDLVCCCDDCDFEEGKEAREIAKVDEELTDKIELEDGEVIVDTKVIEFKEDPNGHTPPYRICFPIDGVSENSKGYILIYDGSSWVKVDTEFKAGMMCAVNIPQGLLVKDGTQFAFILEKGTYNPSSPQTSASLTGAVVLVGAAAAAGALVLKKKED